MFPDLFTTDCLKTLIVAQVTGSGPIAGQKSRRLTNPVLNLIVQTSEKQMQQSHKYEAEYGWQAQDCNWHEPEHNCRQQEYNWRRIGFIVAVGGGAVSWFGIAALIRLIF